MVFSYPCNKGQELFFAVFSNYLGNRWPNQKIQKHSRPKIQRSLTLFSINWALMCIFSEIILPATVPVTSKYPNTIPFYRHYIAQHINAHQYFLTFFPELLWFFENFCRRWFLAIISVTEAQIKKWPDTCPLKLDVLSFCPL